MTPTSGVFHDLHERPVAIRHSPRRSDWSAVLERSPAAVGGAVAIGALLVMLPVLAPRLSMPWVSHGEAPGTTLFGRLLIAGAVGLLVLAVPLTRGDRRAVPLAAGLAAAIALYVAIAAATMRATGAFLDYEAPAQLAVRMGPGPVIAAWGAVFALASLRLGPTLAATLVGGATIATGLLMPTWPNGAPALLTPLVIGLAPWLLLAAIGTWMRLRERPVRGADVVAFGLLTLGPLLPFVPFPPVVAELVSAPARRDLVSGDDVLFLVAAGAAWLAVGMLLGIPRRPRSGETRPGEWAAVRASLAALLVGALLLGAGPVAVATAAQWVDLGRQPAPHRFGLFLDHTLRVETRIDRFITELKANDLREVRSGGAGLRSEVPLERDWLDAADVHTCFAPYRDAYRAWIENLPEVAAAAMAVSDLAGRETLDAALAEAYASWRFPLEEARLGCRLAR